MSFSTQLSCGLTISLLLCAGGLMAQSAPDKTPCRIRFVNCAGTAQNVVFTLDGKDANPKGYAAGKSSGWIGVRPGGHLITATHPQLGSIRVSVSPAKGESIAVIALMKAIPGAKEGDAPTAKLRYLTVPFRPMPDTTSVRHVTLLSVAETDLLEVSVGTSAKASLKRFELSQVALPDRGGVTAAVKHKDESLCTLNFEQYHNQAVVVYQDASGMLAALDFFQP